MSLLGSQGTGLGSVPTAAGGSGAGTGSGGTIREITSVDGSVTVTNPNGPITDLSVPGAAGAGWGLELSYGDGNGSTDDDLPVSLETETEFWIGEGMDADHAGPLGGGQVREWPTHTWLTSLRLVAYIDRAQFAGVDWAGSRLVVTVDGVETGIEIAYSDVVVTDDYQTVAADYLVAPGSRIGLKLATVALGDGSKLRGHFRVIGEVAEAPVGPYVTEDLTLWLESISDDGFDIETDVDGVTVWPDRSTYENDAIKRTDNPGLGYATIEPAVLNGQPAVRFYPPFLALPHANSGYVGVKQDATILSPPVGPTFAPMHSFHLIKVRSFGGFFGAVAMRYFEAAALANNSGLWEEVPVSVGGAIWRAGHTAPDFGTSIIPSPGISLLGSVVLMEFIIDGAGDLSVLVNGLSVPLAPPVTATWVATPAPMLGYLLGAKPDGGDAEDADHFAHMVYRTNIGSGEAAQTRAYIRERFGL